MNQILEVVKKIFSVKGLGLLLILIFITFINNILYKYLKYDLGLISIPGTVKFGGVTIKLSFILGYSISILVAIIYNATSLSKSIDKCFENLYGITFNKR